MILGLTGGMGCGKSTVAAIIAAHGWEHSDADRTIREVLLLIPEVEREVCAHFGKGVMLSNGRVCRSALAQRVFAEEAELSWLENLLHPLLYDHWTATFSSAKDQNWVVEVPLLFEKRLEKWFDLTACVSSEFSVQLCRLAQRGIPTELAKLRIAKQLPLASKIERADYVISNNGSLDFLTEQVSLLMTRLAGN